MCEAFDELLERRYKIREKEFNERFCAKVKELNDEFSAKEKELNDEFSAKKKELNDEFSAKEKRNNNLMIKLAELGRITDMFEAAKDKSYQHQLFEEFGI